MPPIKIPKTAPFSNCDVPCPLPPQDLFLVLVSLPPKGQCPLPCIHSDFDIPFTWLRGDNDMTVETLIRHSYFWFFLPVTFAVREPFPKIKLVNLTPPLNSSRLSRSDSLLRSNSFGFFPPPPPCAESLVFPLCPCVGVYGRFPRFSNAFIGVLLGTHTSLGALHSSACFSHPFPPLNFPAQALHSRQRASFGPIAIRVYFFSHPSPLLSPLVNLTFLDCVLNDKDDLYGNGGSPNFFFFFFFFFFFSTPPPPPPPPPFFFFFFFFPTIFFQRPFTTYSFP